MIRTEYQETLEVIAYLEWSKDRKAKEIERAKAKGGSYAELSQKLADTQDLLQAKQSTITAYTDFRNMLSGIDVRIFEKYYIEGRVLADVAKDLKRSQGYIRQRHTALRKRISMYQALQTEGVA